MKKLTFVTAASIAALLAATPAIADTPYADAPAKSSATLTNTQETSTKNLEKTRSVESNTTESSKNSMSTDVIKASLLPNDPSVPPAPISVDKRMTASGMIGKPVYNQQNERVAT